MRLVWITAAVGDLEQIADYLLQKNPGLAAPTIQRIFISTSELKQFPSRGRPGRKEGTRALVLRQLPYLVVYEVVGPSVNSAARLARSPSVA
jgi:toxin ParE1/3/4